MATAPKATSAAPTPLAVPPAAPEGSAFTKEELHSMAEGLEHGQQGWVKLDEKGKPTGPVLKEAPKEKDGAYARVVGISSVKDEILTPTGAPVTKNMNPENALWDEGMLTRNPIPETKK